MLRIIVLILFSQSIFAQSNHEKAIIELEKSRFEALVKKDYSFLNAIFSDKLIYNHADGKIDSKNSFLEGLKSGKRTYKSINLDTLTVRFFEKTAILNGDVNFVRLNNKQEEIKQKLRYTAVYCQIKRQWQMVSWHSSDITNITK
jgi:Domain of unknown function (DUF4440)